MADADPAVQIELFLRNALREKAIEEAAISKALKALRPVLERIERLVEDSGVMQVGPRRESSCTAAS